MFWQLFITMLGLVSYANSQDLMRCTNQCLYYKCNVAMCYNSQCYCYSCTNYNPSPITGVC